MTRITHMLLASVLSSSCARVSPAPSSAEGDPGRRLDAAVHQRDQLSRQYATNSPELRERCELSAGDCLIAIRERRSDLMAQHADVVLTCPPTEDPEVRFRCVARKPEPATGAQPNARMSQFADYYRDESACLGELVQCTVKMKKAALAAGRESERRARRRAVETLPAATAARNAVTAIEEKIKYVRLTFPVQTDDICVPEKLAGCLEQADQKLAPFEAELAKPSGYDAQVALAAYRASKESARACHEPELACLSAKLSDFGVTPETRRLVDRNFALIEERQRLASQVDDTVAQKCVQTGVERHQADILQRYQDYVGQSKLYFRFQLERAFLALHAEQVNCLKQRGRRSSG